MSMSKQNRAAKVFDTIADVGSLCMAILYILYVTLLLSFDVGRLWLNYCMLAITLLYIGFFLIKIFSLNQALAQRNVQRTARMTLRYSKWAMKLVNALFVILTIASAHYSADNVIMMIGVFVVVFSFAIAILWEIIWYIVRRKLGELKADWDRLPTKEKNKRIAVIIESFVRSVDNVTGINVAESVPIVAGKIVAEKREDKKKPELSAPKPDVDADKPK